MLIRKKKRQQWEKEDEDDSEERNKKIHVQYALWVTDSRNSAMWLRYPNR